MYVCVFLFVCSKALMRVQRLLQLDAIFFSFSVSVSFTLPKRLLASNLCMSTAILSVSNMNTRVSVCVCVSFECTLPIMRTI